MYARVLVGSKWEGYVRLTCAYHVVLLIFCSYHRKDEVSMWRAWFDVKVVVCCLLPGVAVHEPRKVESGSQLLARYIVILSLRVHWIAASFFVVYISMKQFPEEQSNDRRIKKALFHTGISA